LKHRLVCLEAECIGVKLLFFLYATRVRKLQGVCPEKHAQISKEEWQFNP